MIIGNLIIGKQVANGKNEHVWNKNIAKTTPTKHYVPDDTVIRAIISNIHNLIPTTIE